MDKAKHRRKPRPLPAAEASYIVDPQSDLVTAHELRVWRSHPTTKKVLRYLGRWRGQLVERLAEGESTESSAEATAMRTADFVARAQLLRDVLTLDARDLAQFYGLKEPKDDSEGAKA